jgi:hypothetical protein
MPGVWRTNPFLASRRPRIKLMRYAVGADQVTVATIDRIFTEVMPLMRGFDAPWCIAGGWAIDLFLGQVTRPHGDIEIAIFRQDQAQLRRHLPNWTFRKVVDGHAIIWSADEELKPPIHEIHAQATKDPQLSLEILLNERSGNDWIFRRDPRIHMPLKHAIVRDKRLLPILCPAIVLLFKAKNPRPKDDADFRSVRGEMSRDQLRWLEESLRVCDPTHRWLSQIRDSDPDSGSTSASGRSTESYPC